MFEQGLTNSDILFKKSLRSGHKSAKSQRKQSQYQEVDAIHKLLSQIAYDLQSKPETIQTAIQLITEESNQLKQHLSFQLFIPEAKTAQGERILKHSEIWIILLVVFHCICNDQLKYSEYLLLNIESNMQKHGIDEIDIRSIKRQVSEILSQQDKSALTKGVKEKENVSEQKPKKKLRVQFSEVKENQNIGNLNNKLVSGQKVTSPNKLDKIQQNSALSVHQLEINNQCLEYQQQCIEPEVEDIINEHVKEFEEELKNQQQLLEKKNRLSLTEKLFSKLGLKPWRSETKYAARHSSRKKVHEIQLYDGIDSKELSNNIIANVEKILIENVNGNGYHQIVQLSEKNPEELLSWGMIAMAQCSNDDFTDQQYLEDFHYYKTLIAYRFRQEKKIYIPFNKYHLYPDNAQK